MLADSTTQTIFFFIDGLGFGLSVEEENVLKRVDGCDLLGCYKANWKYLD
jgi:hypothetical protein